jgi:AraC family transcriptional regulator, glycine betaine-responsive activator
MSGPSTESAEPPSQLVGLYLVENFTMVAFTSVVECLRLANYVSRKPLFSWKLYSIDGQPARASNGIAVGVDGSLAEMEGLPRVVVCAGIGVETMDHRALVARLRRMASHGVHLGSVCVGTFVLAEAGLLSGHRCTTHWEYIDVLRERYPDLDVVDDLYQIDRTRFTSGGGTAAIDMMLALIASWQGPDIAAAVTDALIHHRMRAPEERQRMSLAARLRVSNPKLLQAVALMEANLEAPMACSEIAEEIHLSPRQMERLFRDYLAEKPARYYIGLRLKRARHLLRHTGQPVLDVAIACGFASASHFSKTYGEHFGVTPSEDRSPGRRSRTGGRRERVAG